MPEFKKNSRTLNAIVSANETQNKIKLIQIVNYNKSSLINDK